jgi:Uncharacterized protein conserved in bacteria (DUF2188)
MLGRHVYRVQPLEGRWTVTKDGQSGRGADFANRQEAMVEARRLADADQPSKIILGDGDGLILEEHLFGQDLSDELDASGAA